MSISNRNCNFLTVLMTLSIFPYSYSSAQECDGDLPMYLMEEIVVNDMGSSPASEVNMDHEWLQAQQAGSAAEILTGVPGSSVTVGDKNSSEIMIRGFTSRDVLVMVDGRPINEPYYGTIDLSTIGVGNIAKIKVVKGASTVRYGPNAMGGVVNIITGGAYDGSPVDVRMTFGSGREIRTDIVHRGYRNNFGYQIHAGRNTTSGFPLSSDFEHTSYENGNERNNSDFRQTDLAAKLLFGSRNNPRWSLNIGGSHLAKGLPSSVYEPRFWRFRDWDRTSLDLDGEPIRRDTFRVKTKLYVERFLNTLVDYRNNQYDPSNVYWVSTHDNRSAGLLVSSSYFPDEKKMTNFGFQMLWDESNRQADKGLDWFVNRTTTSWIFIEHERYLTSYLLLRGGISGHIFSYDSWNRTSATLNPSLNVEWTLRDYIITGAVSRVTRFPILHQLFSETSGNPDLDPEWAYKGEITVSRTLLGVGNLSVSGFVNRVYDMIDRSGKLGKYHNIETADLDGIEMNGYLKLPELEVSSSVSFLDARDGNGEKLEYRPQWKVDSHLNYRPFKNIHLYFMSRVVGRRWTEINSYLDSYHVENAGIIWGENRDISVSVNLKNILDVNYGEEYGFPMAGRTIWAGIDWRYTKK